MESNFIFRWFLYAFLILGFVLDDGVVAEGVKPDEAKQLRDEVKTSSNRSAFPRSHN